MLFCGEHFYEFSESVERAALLERIRYANQKNTVHLVFYLVFHNLNPNLKKVYNLCTFCCLNKMLYLSKNVFKLYVRFVLFKIFIQVTCLLYFKSFQCFLNNCLHICLFINVCFWKQKKFAFGKKRNSSISIDFL